MISLTKHDTISTLKKHGVRPSKKAGQSFLVNSQIANAIVTSAQLKPTETVLEIGGGLGILSELLCQKAKRVYIIEIDSRLIQALNERLIEYDNVSVIHGNALEIELPSVDKVISNLPYSISSEITFKIIRESRPSESILMYQKEFAERLLAKCGSQEYSRLTIGVQYLADVSKIMEVPAEYFYPRPSVDSMVVRIIPRKKGPFAMNEGVFHWMVQGIYPYPNKHLRKALRIWFKNIGVNRDVVDSFLGELKPRIEGTKRLRELSLEELVKISDFLASKIEKGNFPSPNGERS